MSLLELVVVEARATPWAGHAAPKTERGCPSQAPGSGSVLLNSGWVGAEQRQLVTVAHDGGLLRVVAPSQAKALAERHGDDGLPPGLLAVIGQHQAARPDLRPAARQKARRRLRRGLALRHLRWRLGCSWW